MNLDFKRIKHISTDLVYSVAAIFVLNAVIQLVVYPSLTKAMGAEAWGNVLTLLSVISIAASSFGSAANYSRMLASARHETERGDYNFFLAVTGALSVAVGLVALAVLGKLTPLMAVLFSVLMLFSVYRYYADVKFRMTLNYRAYFVFYAAVAAGYLVGLPFFRGAQSWVVVFILGEGAALLFAALRTDLLRLPLFSRSPYFNENMRALVQLSASNLLASFILNADRLLVRSFIGAAAVTTFYTATLIGKVVAMLSTPLNGVLIGYLSKYKKEIKRKTILMVMGLCLLLAIVATFACYLVSLVFVKIMYPDIYELSRPFFLVANASQIFFFISNSLMVLIMRIRGEKSSLWVSIAHIALFVVFVVPGIYFGGLWGLAYSLLLVNFLKFVLIGAIGYFSTQA